MEAGKYTEKVLEFLPEKMRELFEKEKEKGRKIIDLVIRERISKFGEVKKMSEEGEFDYYFQRPGVADEVLIFKDGSLEESKKYLREIVKKVSDLPEND